MSQAHFSYVHFHIWHYWLVLHISYGHSLVWFIKLLPVIFQCSNVSHVSTWLIYQLLCQLGLLVYSSISNFDESHSSILLMTNILGVILLIHMQLLLRSTLLLSNESPLIPAFHHVTWLTTSRSQANQQNSLITPLLTTRGQCEDYIRSKFMEFYVFKFNAVPIGRLYHIKLRNKRNKQYCQG